MNYTFRFKYFHVNHSCCAMKVGTDAIMLGAWVDVDNAEQVLDIGAGTGILSLIAAQRNAVTCITALEIDGDCAKQAMVNFRDSPWSNRLQCIETNARDWESECKFDLIISNPPYFANSLKADNKTRNLARHTDTLSLIDLFKLWDRSGSDESTLAVVLPYSYLPEIQHLCQEYGRYIWRQLSVKPKETVEPNRLLLQLSRTHKSTEKNELVIHAELGYTKEYKQLTKDLYLGH